MDYTSPLTEGLVLLASLGFLVAIYFAYKLWRETRGERYWPYFLVSAVALGVREWAVIPVDLHLISRSTGILIVEASAIVGGLAFAYASYGLYASMKRIREHLKTRR